MPPKSSKKRSAAQAADPGDQTSSLNKKSNFIKVTDGYQEEEPKTSENNGDTAAPSTATGPCISAKAFPEVYTVSPRQSKKKKTPGQLTATQIKQYFKDGFVVLPDFFAREELDIVRQTVEEDVERIAQKLYDGGKITDKHEGADLFHRLTLLEKDFPGASILLHKSEVLPQGYKNLWSNERILNMMEQLIGPEVAGNPVWNLRCKTPFNEQADLPWHQDNAFFDENAVQTLIPSMWIPLLDVNSHNGTLQMVRGGHRRGITATHTCCAGGSWYVQVTDDEMEKTLGVDMNQDVVTCEFEYGGAVLFNNCIPHRSLPNESDSIRWALDFRYQHPDMPVGLWGIKESILMRTRKVKNFKINWENFEKVDRTDGQKNTYKAIANSEQQSGHEQQASDQAVDDFDTTLSGPWMHRWELVHHNRHTATLKDMNADDAFMHKA